MISCGFYTQHEDIGNALGGVVLNHQCEDLPFPLGQFRKRLGGELGASRGKVVDQALRDRRTEYGITIVDRVDRPQHIGLYRPLDQIPARRLAPRRRRARHRRPW